MGDSVYPFDYDIKVCPTGTSFEIGDGWQNGHGRTWKGKMKKFAIYKEVRGSARARHPSCPRIHL